MAVTPIPVGYGILTLKYTLSGRSLPYAFTFGFKDDGTSSAAGIASTMGGDWLSANPASGVFNNYVFNGAHVLVNRSGSLISGDYVTTSTGTVAGSPSSPAVAMLVKKTTGFAGRKFRGRFYLPPAFLGEANVDAAGNIDSATVTGRQTCMNTFFASCHTHAFDLYLLHRDGSGATALTGLTVESLVATQRRRQRK